MKPNICLRNAVFPKLQLSAECRHQLTVIWNQMKSGATRRSNDHDCVSLRHRSRPRTAAASTSFGRSSWSARPRTCAPASPTCSTRRSGATSATTATRRPTTSTASSPPSSACSRRRRPPTPRGPRSSSPCWRGSPRLAWRSANR